MRKGVSGIPIKQNVMAAFLMGKRLFFVQRRPAPGQKSDCPEGPLIIT